MAVYEILPHEQPNYKRRKRRKPLNIFSANTIIIALNVILFIIFTLLLKLGVITLDSIAIKPSNILQGKYLWTFLTSMFMHANFFHLFVNMFSMFFIGSLIEKIIGKRRFVKFYLVAGIFAGLLFVLAAYYLGGSILGARVFGSPNVFGVGASGALFGLVGLLAILLPKKEVQLISGPLLAIIIQAILNAILPSSAFMNIFDTLITIYIFFAIFSMFSFNKNLRKIGIPIGMPFWLLPIIAIIPLIVIGLFVELPIGNVAHLGGLLAGLGYGFYLRKKFKKKVQLISKRFS